MRKWLKSYIDGHIKALQSVDEKAIACLIKMVEEIREQDGQIFVIGNGGSAACSSHLTVDLGKGASLNKRKRFRVFSLVDNTPWVTALGNDLSYEDIFAEQIENFAKQGDLLLAISVSGSSPNLIKAVERAKHLKLKTAALVGDKDGKLINMVDMVIVIPSKHYGHVEDIQSAICHMISYYFIENEP